MADLFPAGQTGAQNAYLAATSGYPAAAPAPAAVTSAQATAITAWWAGRAPSRMPKVLPRLTVHLYRTALPRRGLKKDGTGGRRRTADERQR